MRTLVICASCGKANRVPLDAGAKGIPVCGSCKRDLPLRGAVQDLDAFRLARLIDSADRPVVVDFWAPWCGPCRAFAPTFESAARAKSDRFIFAKLNTEAEAEAARAHGIRGIPTLIVFKGGREIDRRSGAMPELAFERYLDQWA